MSQLTFFSPDRHGSQDLQSVYLQTTKGFTSKMASRTTIYSNLGAIVGGMLFGYIRSVQPFCQVRPRLIFVP